MSGINSITQRSTFIFPSIPRRYGDASITTARNFQPWVTHLLQTVQTYINDSLRCGPCWIYAICGPREAGRPKPYAVGRNGVGRLLWRYHLTIPCSPSFLSAWPRTWKMPTTRIISSRKIETWCTIINSVLRFNLEQISGNEISEIFSIDWYIYCSLRNGIPFDFLRIKSLYVD